mmetsp:Transcript_24650/g.62404  ORF Transcript_24650/g.62404 Transcript_24650/m.62404 type:complete len:222 (-) Transcript_24650:245-910(-)
MFLLTVNIELSACSWASSCRDMKSRHTFIADATSPFLPYPSIRMEARLLSNVGVIWSPFSFLTMPSILSTSSSIPSSAYSLIKLRCACNGSGMPQSSAALTHRSALSRSRREQSVFTTALHPDEPKLPRRDSSCSIKVAVFLLLFASSMRLRRLSSCVRWHFPSVPAPRCVGCAYALRAVRCALYRIHAGGTLHVLDESTRVQACKGRADSVSSHLFVVPI